MTDAEAQEVIEHVKEHATGQCKVMTGAMCLECDGSIKFTTEKDLSEFIKEHGDHGNIAVEITPIFGLSSGEEALA